MATLNIQNIGSIAGNAVTYAPASAGGDRVAPGNKVFLVVRNGSAAAITATIDATGTAFNGQGIPDTTVTIAAGAEKFIPIRTEHYKSASDGLAGISYSAATSVTVAAIAF